MAFGFDRNCIGFRSRVLTWVVLLVLVHSVGQGAGSRVIGFRSRNLCGFGRVLDGVDRAYENT